MAKNGNERPTPDKWFKVLHKIIANWSFEKCHKYPEQMVHRHFKDKGCFACEVFSQSEQAETQGKSASIENSISIDKEVGSKNKKGFFKKLVQGDFGLSDTFWLFGVILGGGGAIAGGLAINYLINDSFPSPEHVVVSRTILMLLCLYFLIVQLSVVAAAKKYRRTKALRWLSMSLAIVSLPLIIGIPLLIINPYIDTQVGRHLSRVTNKGDAFLKELKLKDAKNQYDKVLSTKNNRYGAKIGKVKIAIIQEDYEQASIELVSMEKKFPLKQRYLQELKLFVTTLQNKVQVKALTKHQKNTFIDMYLLYSEYKIKQGLYKKGVEILSLASLYEYRPSKKTNILGSQGWYLLLNGDFDEALILTKQAYTEAPDTFAWAINLGHLYLFKGEDLRAYEYYSKALTLIKHKSGFEGFEADFKIFINNGWHVEKCKVALSWARKQFENKKLL